MAIELLPGGKAFQLKLRNIERRASNFVPAFETIDRAFTAGEKKIFASEGPGWAPLAQSTVDLKSNAGYPSDMLVRGEPGHTEGLKQSLTSHAAGTLFQISPLTLTIGTSVSYAHWHQSGTARMPRRSIMPAYSKVVPEWLLILQAYLVRGVAAANVVGAAVSKA